LKTRRWNGTKSAFADWTELMVRRAIRRRGSDFAFSRQPQDCKRGILNVVVSAQADCVPS
jgi:hypothetical protein